MSHNCKMSLKCTPIQNSLQAKAGSLISFTQKLTDPQFYDVVFLHPFKKDDMLTLSVDRVKLIIIDLNDLDLSSG
jgi:hypothetical protein